MKSCLRGFRHFVMWLLCLAICFHSRLANCLQFGLGARQALITNTNTSTSLLDNILARGYLKVGTTGDYKPFSYLTNTTNLTTGTSYIGADIDMAFAISTSMGLNGSVLFIPTTFGNLTTDIAAKKCDIAMSGISITLARALKAFYSSPILRVGKAPIVRCTDVSKFSTLAGIDQPGVRVATPAGGSNYAFDVANLHKATILTYANNVVIFQALVDHEADVVITDAVEAQLQANLHNGILCAVNPGQPFSFEELGYLMPRDLVWQEFVNVWFRIQMGRGVWNATLERWMEYKWPQL